ncbi:hypothetical protein TGARI_222300 [Toxoplasma gondii ARI]|uniref:Transmembrane protein n=1 Tax=Toxoplasma gondii ARI TaxID=1074872 RepID=A0A139XV02_TOXGO|nr:hypothetical protein TGARI_222300 [Toxoplasma gondii ARI]
MAGRLPVARRGGRRRRGGAFVVLSLLCCFVGRYVSLSQEGKPHPGPLCVEALAVRVGTPSRTSISVERLSGPGASASVCVSLSSLPQSSALLPPSEASLRASSLPSSNVTASRGASGGSPSALNSENGSSCDCSSPSFACTPSRCPSLASSPAGSSSPATAFLSPGLKRTSHNSASPHFSPGGDRHTLGVSSLSPHVSSAPSPRAASSLPGSAGCCPASSCADAASKSRPEPDTRRSSLPFPLALGSDERSSSSLPAFARSPDNAHRDWGKTGNSLFEEGEDFQSFPDMAARDTEDSGVNDLAPSPLFSSGVRTPEDASFASRTAGRFRRQARRMPRASALQSGDEALRPGPLLSAHGWPRSRELRGRLPLPRARGWTGREEVRGSRGFDRSAASSLGSAHARETGENASVPVVGRPRPRLIDGPESGASLSGGTTPEDSDIEAGSPAASDVEGEPPLAFFGASRGREGLNDEFSLPSKDTGNVASGRGGDWHRRDRDDFSSAGFLPHAREPRRRGVGARPPGDRRRLEVENPPSRERRDAPLDPSEAAEWMDTRAVSRPSYGMFSDFWRSPRARPSRGRDALRGAASRPRTLHGHGPHEVSVHLGDEVLEDEGGFVTAVDAAEDWQEARRSRGDSASWAFRREPVEDIPAVDRRGESSLFFPEVSPGEAVFPFATRGSLGLFSKWGRASGRRGKGAKLASLFQRPRFFPRRQARGWSHRRWGALPFAAGVIDGERRFVETDALRQEVDDRRFFPVRIPPLVRSMDVGLLLYERRDEEESEDEKKGDPKISESDGRDGNRHPSLARQLRQEMDTQLDLSLDDAALGDLIDESMRRRLLLEEATQEDFENASALSSHNEGTASPPGQEERDERASRSAPHMDRELPSEEKEASGDTLTEIPSGEKEDTTRDATKGSTGVNERDSHAAKTGSQWFSFQAVYKEAVEKYRNDPRLPQVHAQAEQIQRALASRIKRKISLDAALRRHNLPLNSFSWMARAFVYFNRFQLRNVLFTLWKDHVLHRFYRLPRRVAGAGSLPQVASFEEEREPDNRKSPSVSPVGTANETEAEAEEDTREKGDLGAATDSAARRDNGEASGEMAAGGREDDADFVGIEDDWRLYVQRVYGIDLAQHPTLALPLLVAKHVFFTQRYISFVTQHPVYRFRFLSHKRWLAEQMRQEVSDVEGALARGDSPTQSAGVRTPEPPVTEGLEQEGEKRGEESAAVAEREEEQRDVLLLRGDPERETPDGEEEKAEQATKEEEHGETVSSSDSLEDRTTSGPDTSDEMHVSVFLPKKSTDSNQNGSVYESLSYTSSLSSSEASSEASSLSSSESSSEASSESSSEPSSESSSEASSEASSRSSFEASSLSSVSVEAPATEEGGKSVGGGTEELEIKGRRKRGAKKGFVSSAEASSGGDKEKEKVNADAARVNNREASESAETEGQDGTEEGKTEETRGDRQNAETQAESLGVYGDMSWQAE